MTTCVTTSAKDLSSGKDLLTDAAVEISDDSDGIEFGVEYDAQAFHWKKERRKRKKALRKQQPLFSTQVRPGGSSSDSPQMTPA